MFCPSCHEPNPAGGVSCQACETRLPERGQLFLGQQFVLLNADADRPIAARLDDGLPVTMQQPTIISRHRHAVAFGDSEGGSHTERSILDRLFRSRTVRRPQGRTSPTHYYPLLDQQRLDSPNVDLTAVVTERRIYSPDDEAHIFVVAPDYPGGEVELEVMLSNQTIMRDKVRLDAGGLALLPYADLQEGEYSVRVRRGEKSEWADCRFSVAEFTLSPLIATLESHSYKEGVLSFQLRVLQLSIPYTGEAELGLQCAACGDRVVETKAIQIDEGVAAGEFDLESHTGPFKIQIATPQGETATVDLPGSGASERERIVINPLGRVAEGSLLPGEDTEEVRGLHVGYGDVNAAPLRLESAVAREACLTAASNFSAVQIVSHNPISGESAVQEWRDVARGDRLTLDVNPPFTLFTVAVTVSDGLFESWATVIRPADVEATLDAPEQASPGDQITVSLSADPSARQPSSLHCLLLVYDVRLEHESPLPKLGQRQYQTIRGAGRKLGDGAAPDATQLTPLVQFRSATLAAPTALAGEMLANKSVRAMFAPGARAIVADQMIADGASPRLPIQEAVEAPPLLVPPSREDFPELVYLELFEFEGQAERVVPLGDQIGTWRCRAYLVSGLDVVELTADVQASKPLYAELDLPAIVAAGDEIEASVNYHSDGPAEMTITLPDGETIQGMVMGHGSERVRLTGPGEVSVQLSGATGQDWSSRIVKAPGVQTVTASRLELLRTGETVSGERVVVYPGMSLVLTDTIEALLRYPFG